MRDNVRRLLIFLVVIGIGEIVDGAHHCALKFVEESEEEEEEEDEGNAFIAFFKSIADKVKQFATMITSFFINPRAFGLIDEQVRESNLPECKQCLNAKYFKAIHAMPEKKTGCRCGFLAVNTFECVCCFHVAKWDFVFCLAGGIDIGESTLFVILCTDNMILFEMNIALDPWLEMLIDRLQVCFPLPVPITFVTACLGPTLELPSKENDESFVLCLKVAFGILTYNVIEIRPACFYIKFPIDEDPSMYLDGQEDPYDELAVPAEATPIDKNENFGPMLCLSNSQKKGEARNYDNLTDYHDIDDKVNWRLSKLGETPFLAILHAEIFPKRTQDSRGDLDKYPHVGYAINHNDQWLEDTGQYHPVLPLKACGGALVTTNKVVTICACVRSYYFMTVLKKPAPAEPGRKRGIDEPIDPVFKGFDISASDIFVEFSGVSYTANEAYKLVKDDEYFAGFLAKTACAKMLASQITTEPSEIISKEPLLVVVKFEPDISYSEPSQFLSWPPTIFDHPTEAILVGFGLAPLNETWLFRADTGRPIYLDEEAVDFFLKPCEASDEVRSELTKKIQFLPQGGRGAVFCPPTPEPNLHGGRVGFPVMTATENSQLIGLSVSPALLDHGYATVVAMFTEEAVNELGYSIMSRGHRLNPTASFSWLRSLSLPAVASLFFNFSN